MRPCRNAIVKDGAIEDAEVEDEVARLSTSLRETPDAWTLLNDRGEALEALGRWDEAAEDYRRSLVLNPRQPDIVLDLIQALLCSDAPDGVLDEAAHWFEDLVAGGQIGSADAAKTALTLAREFRGSGRPAGAVPLLERTVAQYPRARRVRRSLAECLSAGGSFSGAVHHWERVVGDPKVAVSRDPDAVRELFEAYVKSNRPMEARRVRGVYDDAVAAVSAALVKDPDDLRLLNVRARALAVRGQFREAAQDCQRSLALRPRQIRIARLLFDSLVKAGALGEAASRFERLVGRGAIRPGQAAQCAVELGDAFLRAHRSKGAVPFLRRLLERFPSRSGVRQSLAECLSRAGEFDDAVPLWEQVVGDPREAVKCEPNLVYLLAEAYVKSGRAARALRVCDAADECQELDIDERAQFVVLRSAACRALDDKALACAAMSAIDVEAMTDGTVCIDVAEEQLALGQTTRALKAARRSVDLEPSRSAALFTLAEVSEKAGDIAASIDSMRRCVRADPETFSWWSYLASLYLEAGRTARAVVCYRRGIWLGDRSAETRESAVDVLSSLGRFDEKWLACTLRGRRLSRIENRGDPRWDM